MELPILSFFYNWNNKLHCKAFTTIRMHNPGKYAVGNFFKVMLVKEFLGTVEVIQVKPFLLNNLNTFMSHVDTGYTVEECKEVIRKMYKNKPVNFDTQLFDFVLLKYNTTLTDKS